MLGHFFGAFSLPYNSVAFGTAIISLVPPKGDLISRITELVYECAGTAHTLTVMKALGKTNTSAAAAAGDTTINVNALAFGDDQTLAANDYIVFKYTDGSWDYRIVSGVSTLALTVAALDGAIASNSPVFLMGASGDSGHFVLQPRASTREVYSSPVSGVVDSSSFYRDTTDNEVVVKTGRGLPMLIYSNNATATGKLHCASGYYGKV